MGLSISLSSRITQKILGISYALNDLLEVTATAGNETSPVAIPSVLANDPGATSITAISIPMFELAIDGTGTFTPGSVYANLPIGEVLDVLVPYTNDLGGTANLITRITGSLLSYAMNPSDGGSITESGALASSTLVSLSSNIDTVYGSTVGTVTRIAGLPGVAKLTFASDSDYIGYNY